MSDRRWFWLCAAGVVATRVAMMALTPRACEDAFITFRYSRHLAEGLGPCFNPGERVMGFTSLPWTVWCAAGYALTGSCEAWARISSLLCELATLALVWRMGLPTLAARCFGVLFALLVPFAGLSVVGIEMQAFVLSIAAAVYWRRWWLVAAVAMIRPEGALVALLLSWWLSWRSRAALAVTLAAFYGGCWAYFGAPLPQSVLAKAAVYGSHGPLNSSVWWEWLMPFGGFKPKAGDGSPLMLIRALLFPAVAVGVMHLRGAALRLALCCGVIYAAYIAVGSTYFSWYLVTPLVGLTLTAALGLAAMVRGRVAWAAMALVMACAWYPTTRIYTGRAYTEAQLFSGPAEYLRQHATRSESIILEPIGIIGYVTDMRMVDEVGLVSPAAIVERKKGPGWYARLVRAERPDWALLRKYQLMSAIGFKGEQALFADSLDCLSFTSQYEAVAFFGDIKDSGTTVLMRRIRVR